MDYINEEFGESIDMEHVADLVVEKIVPGRIIKGEIVTIDDSYAYVNVGTKSDGRISLDEFDCTPEVGTIVHVLLQNGGRQTDGVYQFSAKAAEQEYGWQEFLKNNADADAVISGRIVEATNKGKIVDCSGFRVFLPFSLSADLKSESSTAEEYKFKIKSIDKKKRSAVVSRKDYLSDVYAEKWNAFTASHKIGDIVEGEVVKFVEFGVFIRLNEIDALLHRNDMSWKNVFKQRKILKLGEKRDFIILAINEAEKKVSLGLKQMLQDPWANIEEHVSIGSTVDGIIVTVVNTGAFVEVNNEIDGFLPNSELSWSQNNTSVKNQLQKGQSIKVNVIDIKKDDRKLILSHKQAMPNPWDTIANDFPLNSVHKSKVKKIVKFGMFVELNDDIDGLVHVSDISWDDNKSGLLKNYSVGDEIEFKILEIKKDEMKISCGIKQLQKSPWEVIREKYKPKTLVSGTVSGIMPFGIFVKLDDNLEGLVHISEVSRQKIDSLEDVFKIGDAVEAAVVSVDVKKKRISLSIKQFEYVSEREEVNKILRETSPNTVTLGDMVNIKLNS